MPSRPLLLDLFAGAGGAGEGYRRAGFDVIGVDIAPHVYPCGELIVADVMTELPRLLDELAPDVVHASPPCQGFSTITGRIHQGKHPNHIADVRAMLIDYGAPYVIENVEGARAYLRDPIRLCGSSFGLGVRRHRLFEVSEPVVPLPCVHAAQPAVVGVYGQHPDARGYQRPGGGSRGVKARDLAEGSEAMGID